MHSQLVCTGCRTVPLYPSGATNVCCAMCNMVNAVPPPADGHGSVDMWRLPYLAHACAWGSSVRCSCCHTVNLVPVPTASPSPNNVAHVNCGNCHTMLMYPGGAPSVKCAICHFITNVNATPHSNNRTVVVQNPMTVDESGKLVSNVVVGVTT
ncbi:hypothetical protein OROGR_012728 [Orobanche gracilis]